MLKITLASCIEPQTFEFYKETIVIGDGPSDSSDICFPSEGLHKNHLKIILKENDCTAINQANDPFVTLNGQPFWKKKLHEGDTIRIRSHLLKIEKISFDPLEAKIEEKPLKKPFQEQPPLNLTDDPSKIEEAYNLVEYKQQNPKPLSQKNSYTLGSNKILKTFFVFGLLLIAMFTVIFLEIYFRASTKIQNEEMLAAESISDYAMALQYAKVYHIAPQKQNWIDPQFLKNNLIDLLSATSIPCGNIDSQGQFSNCPYILRFYTNRDFSRFLLLAQPNATFSEWIIPKKTLIVDSSLMEIHKTDDLKILNRLLSYPTPLDGSNGDEIKRTILKTDVIPLETLSKVTGKLEFSPPTALSYMKPGAENLIYNAPRYHLFGETFLKKAIAVSEDRFDYHEMHILQSELDTLAKFHDLIFYSSKGMKQAFKGHMALQKLVIPSNYFTGYLITSHEGKIIGSRLIIDNELTPLMDIALEEKSIVDKENQALPAIPTKQEVSIEDLLREQVEAAHDEIDPIIYNIYTILEDVIEKDSIYLPVTIHQLFDLYLNKKEELNKAVNLTVEKMKKSHPEIDNEDINRFLREYGLLDFYSDSSNQDQDPISLKEQFDSFHKVLNVLKSRGIVPFNAPIRL